MVPTFRTGSRRLFLEITFRGLNYGIFTERRPLIPYPLPAPTGAHFFQNADPTPNSIGNLVSCIHIH
jgi:hypothetical protein